MSAKQRRKISGIRNHARLHQALGYRTLAAVHAMPVPGDLGLSLPAREG